MVGSRFCNLTNPEVIRTEKDLVEVNECKNEYAGYFVMGGLRKTLISQNYSKPDHDIVVSSRLKTTSVVKSMCQIRSKAPDGTMVAHRVFIMNAHTNKLAHSDRRIYVKIGDRSKPTSTIYDQHHWNQRHFCFPYGLRSSSSAQSLSAVQSLSGWIVSSDHQCHHWTSRRHRFRGRSLRSFHFPRRR